ncbi:synaptosomal-associated protein 47 [Plakobranchus ocellatus]|uniref:Synaptosomal-associated protein 47 n=1 Tax=Plakobranchus ocellatus TaxID=259542 RepID=A0AAV3Y8E4_9GAST|nr:synaptosomal-associated protein 47 [Plakobranchus ocellatus]
MSGDDRDSSVTWIRQWDASYYCPTFKKWFYGELKLSTNALLFTHSESPLESTQVYLDFMQIKDISRATSSFIFASITVKSAYDDIHWFSSFQDRNATFIVIRHFFEASLLMKSSGQMLDSQPLFSQSTTHRTKLGTDLLNSVYDSDATLKNAASSLAQQGDQLRGLMCSMQDVHQDLTVAERITAGLQSWLGRWKVPKANKATGIILVKDSDIPDVLDMEVLYTRVLSTRVDPQTLGVCRVAAGGLSILDMKQKVHK